MIYITFVILSKSSALKYGIFQRDEYFISSNMENKYSWPLYNTGLNCTGPLIYGLFSISIQLALRILRFLIHRFNQLQIEKSIFDPRLGICGCRGPAVCIVLPFYKRDLSICRFCYLWGWGVPEAIPHGHQGPTVVKF